jgi:hypothetical protein
MLVKGKSLMTGGASARTMTDVAAQMVVKAQQTCKERFRDLVLTWNGFAALDCLMERWDDAAKW